MSLIPISLWFDSAIGFEDLSKELQKELFELQKRMAVELQPLALESTLTMQKVLECPDHTARLQLVRSFIESETKRLQTKKTIQGMFSGSSTSSTAESLKSGDASNFPPEEQVKGTASSSSLSSFTVDDDSFQ